MLRSIRELFDYTVKSRDDELGDVRDFHFDSRQWIIRYLEIDTGGWLQGRRIVLPPTSLGQPDWTERVFPITLSREQIQGSPHFAEMDRIDRDRETQLYTYYGWQPYWAGGIMAEPGRSAIANALGEGRRTTSPEVEGSLKAGSVADSHVRDFTREDLSDPNRPVSGPSQGYMPRPAGTETSAEHQGVGSTIRSVRETIGYHIRATDGDIGHVEDFIVDDTDWMLRYVVVDTRNWLPGKKVLLATWWINEVDWENEKVRMDLSRETIKNSPEFDPTAPINRQYEEVFFDYYGRPKYWL